MPMAMAAAAAAAAVIRPEHAEGGWNHENLLFVNFFVPILVISGPSRPQKWIRLEISVQNGGIGRSGNPK